MINQIKFSDVKQGIGEKLSSSILEKNGFVRIEKKLEWLRLFPEVVQLVLVEKMKSNNIRVRTFCVAREKADITIGGNLTRAHVNGGDEGFGADWYWTIETLDEIEESLEDLSKIFKSIALPWFNQNTSFKALASTKKNFDNSAQYKIDLAEYTKVINGLKPLETVLSADVQILSADVFLDFLKEGVVPYYEHLGFKLVFEDKISLVRKRGDVHDVLIIELVNYGLSLGVYALNWVGKMAFDGSGEYSSDFAFLLNGGAVSDSGLIGVDSGYSFLIGKENNKPVFPESLKHLIDNIVIPQLEKVESYDDFILSVRPDMRTAATHLGIELE